MRETVTRMAETRSRSDTRPPAGPDRLSDRRISQGLAYLHPARDRGAPRARGRRSQTCTVRRRRAAGRGRRGPARRRRARTFCVLEAARRPDRLIGAHVEALLPGARALALGAAAGLATRPPGLKAGLWQLFYFLEAAVLARHLRRIGAVHLHNHFANSCCSVAMLASEMSGVPFSFTLHGPAIFYEPRAGGGSTRRSPAPASSPASAISPAPRRCYFSDQAHWGKLRIVHCGVTPARLRPAPARRASAGA